MQLCGKCGNYNSEDSIFCSHCANRLNNNCPDCGFKNLMQQNFCGSCGKQLLTELNAAETNRTTGSMTAGAGTTPGRSTQRTQSEGGRMPVETDFSGVAEAAALSQTPELEAYALASIEFVNWKQVLASAPDPAVLEQYRDQVLGAIAQRIVRAGGQISASKNNILFISFRRELSPEQSLHRAVQVLIGLLAEPYQFESVKLHLRMGLDLEIAKSRNPLTSTLERSVGLPNTITVSERVFQALGNRYPLEPTGPVSMGNRTLLFYRLTIPEAEPVGAKPPVSAAPVSRPQPTAPPQSIPVQKVAEPIMPPAAEVVSRPPSPPPAPIPEAQPQTLPQPVGSSGTSSTPAFPEYEPPLLGVHNSPRSENLTYEMAIDALTSEWSAFLAQGLTGQKGKVLSLSSTDGLGKSSIIHMARAKVDAENQRAIWMGGNNYRCFHRNSLPLLFWVELMQNLLSLVFEGQPARDVREAIGKFLSFIYETEPPADDLAFLSDFLAVERPQPLGVDTRAQLGRVERFFLKFFRVLAAKRPVILVIEDLMYADPASLDLLNRLLRRGLLNAPVYIILTHNADFHAAGELAEVFQKVPYKELVVGSLDAAAAEKFLDDGPLGGQLHTFPAQLIDPILRQARGLPLYLEESLRLMHLKEVLTVDPQTSKFMLNQAANLAEWQLPDALPAVIFARLEFLTEQEIFLLQLASVLGEKFAVNMLFALAQLDEEAFNAALTTLFNHGYLIPDAVNTGRFRHGLIWETVYETIEPELRVQMHQLISEALENDFNQGITVNLSLIAYHSEHGQLPNRAWNYWNLSGVFCGQIGSLVGLNISMFHALRLMQLEMPEQFHADPLALLVIEHTAVFNLEEEPELAAALLEWVLHQRKQAGESLKLIEPLGFLSTAYENMGDFPTALVALEKSIELVDENAYPLEAASLQIAKLEYLYTLGRLQQARDLMETVIEPVAQNFGAQSVAFKDSYLQACLLKAHILLAQCDPEVMPLLQSTLEEAQQQGLEGLQIALRLAIGQVHLRQGDYETCNREADGLLNAIESMEDSDWFLAQWGLLAITYHCELEDWTSASQLVLTVVSKAEIVRDYQTWVIAQIYAGYIAGRMGKIKDARQLIEQGIGQSSDFRFASAALLGWRFLAEFEWSLDNVDVAYDIAAKALDIAQKPDIRNDYERIQLTMLCAKALLAKGESKEAGRLLEPLWPLAIQSRWQPLIANCAFEIGQLYKALAQNVPADLSRKYLTRSVEFFLKAKGIWLELRNLNQVKKIDLAVPKL